MMRATPPRAAALAAALLLPAILFSIPASAEVAVETPGDSGFETVVVGPAEAMSGGELARHVVEALPKELKDAGANFTRHEAYEPERRYRLVMVFHDPREETPADLCRLATEPRPDAAETRPSFEDLYATVVLTAAFCADADALATASARSAGRIEPGSLSFRYLVGDTAKELFPDGFAALPRTTAAR